MWTNESLTSTSTSWLYSLVPDRSLSAFVSSDLQLKAAEVNKTLSRKDGGPDKSLKVMKEDIQAMLAEMRKRQLARQKGIAEDELGYGHKHTCTAFMCTTASAAQMKMHPWTRVPSVPWVLSVVQWINSLHGWRGRNRQGAWNKTGKRQVGGGEKLTDGRGRKEIRLIVRGWTRSCLHHQTSLGTLV